MSVLTSVHNRFGYNL